MFISEQIIEFSQFVFIGILISVIFDFFRAYRKLNKVSFVVVALQDIIYFLIITVILILSIIFLLNTSIRLYIFVAIFVGIGIYITFFSKYVIKAYMLMFNTMKRILQFIILPIKLSVENIKKIYTFFEKNIKKCCKMFSNMILILCSAIKSKICNLFKKNHKTKEVKI